MLTAVIVLAKFWDVPNVFGSLFIRDQVTKNKKLIRTYDTPASNYMFQVNIKNTKTKFEISSKLTIKTLERRQWLRFGVAIVNFEHISHLVLVFVLLNLSR